jgi:hypothetical protein
MNADGTFSQAFVDEAMRLINSARFEEARRLLGEQVGEVAEGRLLRYLEQKEAEEAAK